MSRTVPHGTALAKTTRPIVTNSVRRESLLARIDASPNRKLAWISGPPGAGKSTLAASYVDARGRPCIWYQVDPEDADAATLFHYLAHAAARLDARRAGAIPAFTPDRTADLAAFARKFFRALFARAREGTVLVFDNLPETPEDSALRIALEAGLGEIPRHSLVIVTSRAGPPARLARLQVSGEMACVGAADLRLSAEELAQIAQLRGLPLPSEARGRLEQRTQGWAAAAVLMLEHAKLAGDLAECPEDATPKVVFDYLAGEIFDRFEPATRQFLTRIAWLPRMSAQVAEALSGDERAARLLRNFAHNDYFVREVRTPDGLIYHLHPLLHDFLRARREASVADPQTRARLTRAAALLRDSGQTEDAMALLTECRHWDAIAAIAAEHAPGLLAQGRVQTLRAWIALLPPSRLENDPQLLYASGMAQMALSPRNARRLLQRAFEVQSRGADPLATARSCHGVMAALLLEFDDLSALDAWIERMAVLARALGGNRLWESNPAALATLILGTLARNPGHPELHGWLAQAERIDAVPSTRAATPELTLARLIARIASGGGCPLPGMAANAPESRAQGAHRRAPALVAAALEAMLAGDHATASAHARALAADADAEPRGLESWANAIAAYGAIAAADRERARACLAALEGSPERLRRGDRALLHWLRAHLALAENALAVACREARSAAALAAETGCVWLEALAQISLGQALAANGERHGAEAALRAAAPIVSALNCPPLELALAMTRAAAVQVAGERELLLAELAAALALGRRHTLTHVPLLQPQAVASLCATALAEQVESEYARALARDGRLVAPAASRLRNWPWSFRLRTLKGFEIEHGETPMAFSGKGPGRPVELLKVLVAMGGQNVRIDQLADALWPRVDADYAHKSFTITLHRLRRMLGKDEAVLVRDARLSLNPALFWVDVWALEQALGALDERLRDPAPPQPGAVRALVGEVLDLYRGAFLADESEQASFIACRDQTRVRIARGLSRLVRRAAGSDTLDVAEEAYLRLIDVDELCEAFHRGLMQCYQRQGDRVEALATYEHLCALLAARLGAAPSVETQAAHAELMAQAPPAPGSQ